MDEPMQRQGDPPHLARREANYVPLSPISFLARTALAHPEREAVIYGATRRNWAETLIRCRRLASAIAALGLPEGKTVAVLAANTPELFEAHFGVPMAGAVLCALNTRLDAVTLAYMLDHSEAWVLIADRAFAPLVREMFPRLTSRPHLVEIDDPQVPGESFGGIDYEAFIASGDADFPVRLPGDEWESISLNYTSGTTGRPKGVLYHHRGAYLLAIGNVLEWHMEAAPRYLWTLPMFHCNGWCFPWTLAATAATAVCLRRVTAEEIWSALETERIGYLCGAPIVLQIILEAVESGRPCLPRRVRVMTAAAPPAASLLARMDAAGFDVTHVYGLTEVYGPAVICEWRDAWNELPPQARAERRARQGIGYLVCEEVSVRDPTSGENIAADGVSLGEVCFRGNIVMKGYYRDPEATEAAFAYGHFHSGDLAVRHPDGHIQIRDRLKDIIISGGENISSIEVEDALQDHPAVAAAAVVGLPDPRWGEIPVAVVELASGLSVTGEALIAFCRTRIAHYKCPHRVIVEVLPRTSTGKIQKRALRARFVAQEI